MKRISEARYERRHQAKLSASKGLTGKAMAVIGLVIAVLIYGALGTGAGSFWYNANNPNTSCLNSALQNANVSCGASVVTLEATVVPVVIAVVVVLMFLPRKKQ